MITPRRSIVPVVAVLGLLGVAFGLSWSTGNRLGQGAHETPLPADTLIFQPARTGIVATTRARDLERLRWLGRLGPEPTLAEALHCLMFDPSATVEVPGRRGEIPLLAVVLDARLGREVFGHAPIVVDASGVRFAWGDDGVGRAAESHPGQALATLAALGLDPDRPLSLEDGRRLPIREAFRRLALEDVSEGEPYWILPGLATFRRDGAAPGFEEACRRMLEEGPAAANCSGTHRLIALAVIARADERSPSLSPGLGGEIRHHLRRVAAHLAGSQDADGSWGPDWHRGLVSGVSTIGDRTATAITRLRVTGHHLEWMLVMSVPSSLDREPLRRAAIWAEAALDELRRQTPLPRGETYCAAVHAARALRSCVEPD